MDLKIVVIGAGEVGYNLVKALSKEKFDITVIDIDEEKCQKITNTMDVQGIIGDGASQRILQKIDIFDSDNEKSEDQENKNEQDDNLNNDQNQTQEEQEKNKQDESQNGIDGGYDLDEY